MAQFDARKENYRMPAEWESMAMTWLGWPMQELREELWGEHYERVCEDFALAARTITRYQPCTVAAHTSLVERAHALCGPGVKILSASAEDNWVRDCGPIFLQGPNQKLAAALFRFNAWGEKYHPYEGCEAVGEEIASAAKARLLRSDMILEGGSFYVDGKGTLLTTESCLLNPNRNPHMNRAEIEEELGRMLGIRKVIWLPGNPEEVETNGHIDGIASFIGNERILWQSADPDQGEYYRIMLENRRALELSTDVESKRFEILSLPSPRNVDNFGSTRYCDCYANYILVNGAVISTSFGVAEDDKARSAFSKAFPNRQIELIPANAISIGGGSLHCSTQQQPGCQ